MRNSLNLVFVIMIFMVLGCVCGGNKRTSNNSPSNLSNTISVYASPTPLPPSAMSSKENLDYGLRAFKEESTFESAKEHLLAIPKGSPEYKPAQELLAKIKDIEKARERNLEKYRRAEKAKADEAKKKMQRVLDSISGKKNPNGHY